RQAHEEREQKVKALKRSIKEIDSKSKRLIRTLEVADDIDQGFIRDLSERRAELRAQREDMEQQLAEAEQEISQAPNPGLIDYLPVSAADLAALPDELSRRLFEALRLVISYDCRPRPTTGRVPLVGEALH